MRILAAIAWYLPSGSIAFGLDQLTETFEFIFSPLPLENIYMLSNTAATEIALTIDSDIYCYGHAKLY